LKLSPDKKFILKILFLFSYLYILFANYRYQIVIIYLLFFTIMQLILTDIYTELQLTINK